MGNRKMKPLEMDVYMDRVDIEKQTIKRPEHITRSFWMSFWESLVYGSNHKDRCPHCGGLL